MDILDRTAFQVFLQSSLEFLVRELAACNAQLERVPKDITAMVAIKKIDNDISILRPLVESCQKQNMLDIEKMTGKRFAYLLENKDVSKDLLKKS